MSRLSIQDTPLGGLKTVERVRLGDDRGFLSRLFCSEELVTVGWHETIAQINHTCTKRAGTVRGLHYQLPPQAETKLVSCLRGAVWDLALDLRCGSPTFLQWHAELLSAENGCALLIPQGFAHGFQTLSDDVDMLYLHSRAYSAALERGVNPMDPTLGIRWPRTVSSMSSRDAGHPMLLPDFEGVSL